MTRSVVFSLLALILLHTGCKSETPSKKDAKVATPTPRASQDRKPSGFISKVPPLALNDVNDLNKLTAIKQYNRGIQLRNENKLDESIAAFLQSLQANPGHLSARLQLAASLALKKEASNAMAVLEQFANAKDCPRCDMMLARAKENTAFGIFSSSKSFRALTDEPAARFNKALAAADWISYNRESLENGELVLSVNGLPAISKDGTRILAALRDREKNDRLVSATLHILDATTAKRRHASHILFEKEGRRLISGKMHPREIMRALDDRISHIHSELVSEKWIPMTLAVSENSDTLNTCGKSQQLNVGDLAVSLSNLQLKITGRGMKTITHDARNWLFKGHERCATTPMVRNIYTSKAHNTLLIELAFCSNTCQSKKSKWTVAGY